MDLTPMLSIRELIMICLGLGWESYWPEDKEDDLNATDDGESSEESHGSSDETQLGLSLDLLVSLDLVKGGRVKVDLHQLKGGMRQLVP